MKQPIFTFLFFTIIALVSCRKDKYDPTITQYDEDQIKSYIATNGITGMVRDTSGIYYKIITPGTGPVLQYTDSISMVFTLKSFDGKYVSADTIDNHFEDFGSHIFVDGYPIGLQTSIYTILKYRGCVARLLIPSHLAYGVTGNGAGSSTLTNVRIGGNQCLDYNVNIISDQNAYDQTVIKSYIAANGLTSTMQQDPSGIWYSITTPGTGTVAITDNTTVTSTYTTSILNGTIVDEYNVEGGNPLDIPDLIVGLQIGLKKYATAGAKITFLLPSSLAYGKISTGTAVKPNSCIRYDVQVLSVSP